jgi:hypothetical protein
MITPEYYASKIKGYLDTRWSDWFSGLKVTLARAGAVTIARIRPKQSKVSDGSNSTLYPHLFYA